MSQKSSTSRGLRNWWHPITKGSRSEGRRARLTAKQVKEVPLDPSLLAQGAKDYGTHRLRRRGLPTHVPQAWLGQHPATASGTCSPVKSEAGGDLLTKAARPSGSTQSFEAKPAPPGSGCSQDLGIEGFDSSYSYVFPSRHHRPVSTAELQTSQSADEVTSALRVITDQPTKRSLQPCTATSSGMGSTMHRFEHSSQSIAERQLSSSPDSFAFPELPGEVLSFAAMPLKPLPELDPSTHSRPGPLEESYLRCQQDQKGGTHSFTQQHSFQKSSSPPLSAQLPTSKSRPPRLAHAKASDCSSAALRALAAAREPRHAASTPHGAREKGNKSGRCGPAPPEKLGPSFEKLLVSFEQRKTQSGRGRGSSAKELSSPALSKLSARLHALQAHAAVVSQAQSSTRRASEDSIKSTAATAHSRTSGPQGTSQSQGSCGIAAQRAAEMSRIPGTRSGAQVQHRSKHTALPRAHGMRSAAADVLAACIASAKEDAAACLPVPADISAEASDQAIRRQLHAIILMLCAAAGLFMGCCILLSWRLCTLSHSANRAAETESTDYALLSPSWWPSSG